MYTATPVSLPLRCSVVLYRNQYLAKTRTMFQIYCSQNTNFLNTNSLIRWLVLQKNWAAQDSMMLLVNFWCPTWNQVKEGSKLYFPRSAVSTCVSFLLAMWGWIYYCGAVMGSWSTSLMLYSKLLTLKQREAFFSSGTGIFIASLQCSKLVRCSIRDLNLLKQWPIFFQPGTV